MNHNTKLRKAAGLLLAAAMLITCLAACGAGTPVTTEADKTAAPSGGTAVPKETTREDPDPTRPSETEGGSKETEVPGTEEPAPALTAERWAENMSFRKTEIVRNTMRFDLFDERFLAYLSEHAKGNYMASPLSFRYALGLLLAGAEGETKAELLKALGVSSEEEWTAACLDFNGFVEYFAADLAREMEEYNGMIKRGWIPAHSAAPFRALRVANSVWKAEWVKEDFTEAYR